jgi:hypothetical protein
MFNDKQPGYKRLRSIVAERTNRIVIWVGSGLSIPADLPSWPKLQETLCQTLVDKDSSIGKEESDIAEKLVTQIRKKNDYWLTFQILREKLGAATYRSIIRESFKNAQNCQIPDNYLSILDLPMTGILSLNLDRLATRAYTGKNPGRPLIEFGGFQAAEYLHVLKGATPFIVNLHGTIEDESSWIFTRDDLRSLLSQEGYITFIRSCLCTRTIIFVGISADDVAVGGHLDALSDARIDLGDHFWITDRTDAITEHWAERTQLQLIRYQSEGGDHSALRDIL